MVIQMSCDHTFVMRGLYLPSKMSNTKMKYHEANLEKTNCYTLCQWWCYLRFQVSLNLHFFSFFFIPFTPTLSEARLLCL